MPNRPFGVNAAVSLTSASGQDSDSEGEFVFDAEEYPDEEVTFHVFPAPLTPPAPRPKALVLPTLSLLSQSKSQSLPGLCVLASAAPAGKLPLPSLSCSPFVSPSPSPSSSPTAAAHSPCLAHRSGAGSARRYAFRFDAIAQQILEANREEQASSGANDSQGLVPTLALSLS